MKKTKEILVNNIENNQFYGVKWDEGSIEAVKIVAQGLLALATLFKSQNINIEAMLKIEETPVVKNKRIKSQ